MQWTNWSNINRSTEFLLIKHSILLIMMSPKKMKTAIIKINMCLLKNRLQIKVLENKVIHRSMANHKENWIKPEISRLNPHKLSIEDFLFKKIMTLKDKIELNQNHLEQKHFINSIQIKIKKELMSITSKFNLLNMDKSHILLSNKDKIITSNHFLLNLKILKNKILQLLIMQKINLFKILTNSHIKLLLALITEILEKMWFNHNNNL